MRIGNIPNSGCDFPAPGNLGTTWRFKLLYARYERIREQELMMSQGDFSSEQLYAEAEQKLGLNRFNRIGSQRSPSTNSSRGSNSINPSLIRFDQGSLTGMSGHKGSTLRSVGFERQHTNSDDTEILPSF